ncbi:MAG TPA: HlyD family type I secretion periplasmic adaptor subunit [Caldimonas sp.]|jgi:hemolysin D|nr:HlyD family type I secretion periplasmic adaptor subunit [Caldimonas sp.]HEX2539805.1 HlyD family type I secretion periplasmic adaptor subunit [Caldimonas sp.]
MSSALDPDASRRHPAIELARRHAAVFGAAWSARHELAGPSRLADEAAFLPAALSLQDTPVHPAPRRTAWTVCALFSGALVWACLGQIDIVAVAPGRIVVSDRTKTLQPLEAGVVKRVLVKDGDSVAAGQVLVELDATHAAADGASLREQLAAAESEALRSRALQAALSAARLPSRPTLALAEAGDAELAARLDSEWNDIRAKLAKLDAEQARRHAEIGTVRELVGKLEATLPIAREREADFRRLIDQGFMSHHAGQDRRRERIEQERDLATQTARLAEARAALHEAERSRSAYQAETQRLLGERGAQAASKRQQLLQELAKTEQRSTLTRMRAPVAGTVQQVAVHTEGGVVTPAQVLMVIVPKDSVVTAEVAVDNKDIGFVNAGSDAEIKLETFTFTRYGTVPARVRTLSADAVTDDKRGAYFPASLTLSRSSIDVDGKRINLSPGMNVTAEIKTGRRRVIDYLLSPVQRAGAESLGER